MELPFKLFVPRLLAAATLMSCAAAASAQDNDVLQSRALAAMRRSTINGGGMHPYRVEGLITMYDGAGKNPVEGTLEILRDGRNARISVAFPSATATAVNNEKGLYTSSDKPLPYYTSKLVVALQQPVQFTGFTAIPAALPRDASTVEPLDCISIETAASSVVRASKAPQHLICLDQRTDQLRMVVDSDEEYVRDNIAQFDEHEVARRLRLRLGGVVVAEIIVNSMESKTFDGTQFVPSAEMKLTSQGPAHVPASMMAGRIVKHENPKYPGAAKAAHIQGVVVLHAVIGKDGHIGDLSMISSPDPLLTEASLKAVKKWVYEPYLLNGQPTEVETTISINFAIGAP